MKKFTTFTLAISLIATLTLSAHADWVTDYNNGVNPISDGKYKSIYKLFNLQFGAQEGIASGTDLLNERGVDPFTTWTASESHIIGAFDVANFGHELTVFNDGDLLRDSFVINKTPDRQNVALTEIGDPIYVGTGDNISFTFDAYWGSVEGKPNLTFNSSETDKNGRYHMLAFDVTDLYITQYGGDFESVYMFAWEDQMGKVSDWDYNDLVVFMTNIEPNSGASTPEPATLAVLGLGLAGLGLVSRRRRK